MIDDNELIGIFIEEMQDLNASLQHQFALWKIYPSQKEPIETILREMHTLKGNARMIGLAPFSEYLHYLEQLWQMLQQSPISADPDLIDALSKQMAFVAHYSKDFAKTKNEPESEIPLEYVKRVIAQWIDPLQPDNKEKRRSHSAKEDKENKESKEGKEGKEKKESKEKLGIVSTDTIRVKIDELNKLALLVSGINVDRAHCDQQNKAVIQSLVEMEKELKILQDHVKQLQIKTDANIKLHAINESEGLGSRVSSGVDMMFDTDADQEFDILEMDYYTSVQQLTRHVIDKIHVVQNMNHQALESTKRNEQILRNQGRLSRQLDEDIRHTRLVSLDYVIPRLEHSVTTLAKELGKSVVLKYKSLEGEIDRKVIDKLVAPLEHLIRNAIDHGIGLPEKRIKVGKSEQGTLTLSMIRQGNDIIIEFSDDGRGINIDEIKAIALQHHYWDGKLVLTDYEFMQMIFLSGFSTKKVATEISGHGVGLDVVNATVNKLGGNVSVKSKLGKGTIFTLKFPVSLSLTQALLFYLGDQLYGISLSQLAGISRLPFQSMEAKLNQLDEKTRFRGEEYALFSLPTLLDNRKKLQVKNTQQMMPVLLLHSLSQAIGFVVDKLVGSAEIVLQPIGMQLQFLKEMSGVAITGNGDIILMLDAMQIMQRALNLHINVDLLNPTLDKFQQTQPSGQSKVMVVDDSNTVRQIMARFLQRNEYIPQLAKNGEEALEMMLADVPDLVLLDLEMPIMNGFEVLQKMRDNPVLAQVPVIVITSRSSEKHQQRAIECGSNAYISKPYREPELLALIQKFIAR